MRTRYHPHDLSQDRRPVLSAQLTHLLCRHLMYLDTWVRGQLLLSGDCQIPSQRSNLADSNVTLLRSRKSEVANLEKSSKYSRKGVVILSCMPSRNPNDLKGQNIGKSIRPYLYHRPGLACLVYARKGYPPIRHFYHYHVAKEQWNMLIFLFG
jgi:hypothetical protein